MASSPRITGSPRILLTALLILALFYLLFRMNSLSSPSSKPIAFDIEMPTTKPITQMHVYYEVLCPDSRHFILNQLQPLYNKAADYIQVHPRPYGKAQTKAFNASSYTFQCQHGPIECLGNKIHACVIDLYKEETQRSMAFVFCTMEDDSKPLVKGLECASSLGLDWALVESCALGLKGQQLLAAFGEETHALRPEVSFIPTITLNGDQSHQGLILKDLTKAVCNLYEEPRPDFC